uniref:Solute carrier organic anion transporter family member n=1 Tax=Mus spicilegus TaxID=10103 RepID=A0A8C6HKE0_MUSSI
MEETETRILTRGVRCFSKVKVFLLALTGACVSKSLTGSHMKSMLLQIERQFGLLTSTVGLITGSFSMGMLLVIIPVSYFGTKLHRPIMIGVGCMFMGLGCFIISLPHFLMGRYEYETTISPTSNLSSNSFLCIENRSLTLKPTQDTTECGREIKSLMWIYVLVGNIRGMGETAIMPLGISYIEDFAKSENSPLYIGILEIGITVSYWIGYSLGSFCANIYVDTDSGNTDDLTITPTDTRWVGAWWIGFLVCAGVNFLTSIPFFFFPKTLPKEGLQDNGDGTENAKEEKHREKAKKENQRIIKGIYMLPPICLGYLLGGFIMKKFKITAKKAACIAFCLSLTDYLLSLSNYMTNCDSFQVAGLTASYEGVQHPLHVDHEVLADCNTRCSCLTNTWDPVCGDNGLAYMSACLEGCEKSVGNGINMVFQNCSCIGSSGNSSAVLGLCNKGPDCDNMLKYFIIIFSIKMFIFSLSSIPGYMVLLRCMKPEEKSLGVGLHTFCTKIFASIPAPIYFGALIDRACLHWGTLKCGEKAAGRIYDINSFRYLFFGLPAALTGSSYLPAVFLLRLMRTFQLPEDTDSPETELPETKLIEKEDNCTDVHRSPKVESDGEMKAKL